VCAATSPGRRKDRWGKARRPRGSFARGFAPLRRQPPRHPVIPLFLLVLAIPFSAGGCLRSGGDGKQAFPPDAKVRLLVVGDPAMAAAIDQLRSEWNAQTGTSFEVEQAPQLDPQAAGPPQADAVISASCDLAVLAEKKWIVPMPGELIRQKASAQAARSKDEETPRAPGNWSDLFTLLRAHEAVWGKEVMAVPFGSPVLVCYYRADLLEKLGAKPPRTWPEYQKLAARLADRKQLGDAAPPAGRTWHGSLEPLAPGWAAIVLLGRAAPYVTHPANYSQLFSIDSMEPLVDGPPFVRALEELVAAAASGPPEIAYDPTAVRHAFWRGECGLALTWPSAADRDCPKPGPNLRVGFAELPGSTEVYNVSAEAWEPGQPGDEAHVPLLDVAGRLGTVTSRSQWPEVSFGLLLWLSDQQWSRQTSAASPATTIFRQADVSDPQAWVEKVMPATAASQYARLTQQTLSRQQWLFALRISGRGEYLKALDEAVQQAVLGQKPPKEALRQAAARWREITKRHGTEAQRAAYRHSLGL
jgi:ABC-type glycerol-3-phosphate transport system substrate-binding protein